MNKHANPCRVVFFGTPAFADTALHALLAYPGCRIALIVTQPDRPAGRHQKLGPPPVKLTALKHNLPLLQTANIRDALDTFLNQAASHGPFDIGVIAAFGQILPPAVLKLPRAGCVNIHASLLPRWRGAAPIQRALMAGDKITGISLMRVSEGLDDGPVYCSHQIEITDNDDAGSLHDRLASTGANLLVQNLEAICSGALVPTPQDERLCTYAKKIGHEEEELVWTHPADLLWRQVRALSPTPGAYTTRRGILLKVFKAKVLQACGGGAHPGEITALNCGAIEVACGEGRLALLEVQPAGKRRMSADEYMRGASLQRGEILGSL